MAEKAGVAYPYLIICELCELCEQMSSVYFLRKVYGFRKSCKKWFYYLHISQNVRTFACDNRILKLLHLIISIYSLNLLL